MDLHSTALHDRPADLGIGIMVGRKKLAAEGAEMLKSGDVSTSEVLRSYTGGGR